MKVATSWPIVFGALLLCVCPLDASAQEAQDSELTFSDLFTAPNIQSIILSPNGEFVVYRQHQEVYVGNVDTGYLQIYDFRSNERAYNIEWISNNSLIVQTRDRVSGKDKLHASKMGIDKDGKYAELAWKRHDIEGYVHDELLENTDEVVFARVRREDEFNATDLYRVDLFAKAKLFSRRRAIDTGSKDYFYYARDASGDYVVGIRYVDSVPEIWRRSPESGDWELKWVATKEAEFYPYSLSEDGNSLYALSNAFTDKVAAIELDLRDGSLIQTLYEHERFDLETLLVRDDEFDPYGVVYSEQGMLRYQFFAEDAERDFQAIQDQFPDKGVIIVGRSNDNSVKLVRTSTSKDRGDIQRCDSAAQTCEQLVELAPWLNGKTLSDTVVLEIDSAAGSTVDAFLTMPVAGGESIPLIALPHGGPIGVSDSRYFSPDVQWLAHNGYAVLQVNYRGSSGYGKEFQSAGLREWGRGIEDDIDAAVLSALARNPQLDRNRIGIYGSSYGGYSALMSVIRNPDLYKCGASFAGVTDLTLLFLQSRMHRNPELREKLSRIIGDPDLDYEEQRAYSPAYRYKEISRPILLAHGTADRVVDVEHSWRLRMLMRLTGVDPEFVILDEIGHGFEYVAEAALLYDPLIEFLDSHLKPQISTSDIPREDPLSGTETQAGTQ